MEKYSGSISDNIVTYLDNSSQFLKIYKRPLVTLSYAQSIDGSITSVSGFQIQISGEETRVLTHKVRALHDGILVGINTIISDNPRLNVRLVEGNDPRPIILDSNLRFPLNSRILKNAKLPWIFSCSDKKIYKDKIEQLNSEGVKIFFCESNKNNQVDIHQVLNQLGKIGISSLMVEGGAKVITTFLKENAVDQILITISPSIIGGYKAVGNLCKRYNEGISSAIPVSFPKCKIFTAERFGNDIVVWGLLEYGNKF